MKRFSLLFGVILLTTCAPAPEPEPAPRPNIVFAFADDWGRFASAYAEVEPGGPSDLIRTPNFDRVADEGVLFTNAFVNAPSCTPCRSSLLSGQYFWRTGRGAVLHYAVWDESIPTYPLLLRDAGYHIGFTYKVWSPGTPRDAPHGGEAMAYHGHGTRFNRFSQHVSEAEDPEQAKQELYEEVRGNFRDFLAKRQEGQPFSYWFGPTNVHRRWTQGSGKALWGLDPDALEGKMPDDLPDVPVVREDLADYFGEAMAFDAGLGVLLEELERIGELENTIVAVSGDHGLPGFPRGKCDLYDLGLRVPLAVRWPKRIPAGRVLSDFVSLPDLAPTFLEAGGVEPPRVMTARSLIPVLESGESGRVDASRDYVVAGRERHVGKARLENRPYPMRALRTDRFLYIRNFAPSRWPMGVAPGYGLPAGSMPSYEELTDSTFVAFGDLDASPTKAWLVTNRDDPQVKPHFDRDLAQRPAEELYDLARDPYQLENVASDPAYAQDRAEAERRLLEILEGSGDPRVTEDPPRYENPPFTDPEPE